MSEKIKPTESLPIPTEEWRVMIKASFEDLARRARASLSETLGREPTEKEASEEETRIIKRDNREYLERIRKAPPASNLEA